jgi:hypothetical protein
MNLHETIVEYVGNKLNPEDGDVTVEMVATVLTDEFPELMLAIAQENFLRGYAQALDDVEAIESEKFQGEEEGGVSRG